MALLGPSERIPEYRLESVAREHARLARTNLDIVLRHREVLDRLPGASLLAFPDAGDGNAEETVPSEAST